MLPLIYPLIKDKIQIKIKEEIIFCTSITAGSFFFFISILFIYLIPFINFFLYPFNAIFMPLVSTLILPIINQTLYYNCGIINKIYKTQKKKK
ncbi:hypothetical protein PFNF135_04917 [Plasmodium falciparum NF135/5.C10]|uniref:Uncharacterized protein n=1 Tax=Plasmodium falciparum NF135/5.C10 TaxID=1036726 RepID=W4IAB6_PLAFA|nr:hypothetical protein PFNF135_04917 [Plasmodium falciparum NF135/5.C10]